METKIYVDRNLRAARKRGEGLVRKLAQVGIEGNVELVDGPGAVAYMLTRDSEGCGITGRTLEGDYSYLGKRCLAGRATKVYASRPCVDAILSYEAEEKRERREQDRLFMMMCWDRGNWGYD